MKLWFFPLLMMGLLLHSCNCGKDSLGNSDPLDRLNWSERNYKVLNELITDYGTGGKYYDKSKAPYVVFDWDQTSAHFDVEEALMRYQMFNLRYKMTKDQFKGLLKDDIKGVKQLPQDFKNILLFDINQDLSNDYAFLYDNYSGFKGRMTLEEIKQTSQYKDFIAKLLFLFEGYSASPGIGEDYALLWVLYLFAGHTVDEVKAMAGEAISYELGNQLNLQTLQSPANIKTKAGLVSCSHRTGLRVFPEIQNLFSTFKKHGIDVFIVSASYKPVVEVFSGRGSFGYNLDPDHIIAMELAIAGDGKIIPEYKAGWIKTFRQGKIDAINKVVKEGLGRNWDPLFSAGDSDGDYEMTTGFPSMKLTLIWNRVKGGAIGKLCKQAVDEQQSPNPRYILQGRNENNGVAMPCSESILFGKTEPQLLH